MSLAGRAGGRWRGRRRIPGFGGVIVALAAAAAVVVAVLAVVLLGDGGRKPMAALSRTPVQTCASGLDVAAAPSRSAGPVIAMVTVAHGSVAGHFWSLQAIAGPEGARSMAGGSFFLSGRRYFVCPDDFELVAANPHGIVYGFLADPGRYSVRLDGVPGTSPPVIRRIRGGTFFVQALPRSACDYRSLGLLVGRQRSASIELLSFGRCVPDEPVPGTVRPRGRSNVLPVQPPAGLSAGHRAEFLAGRGVVAQSGCLACHQIGVAGNGNGIGPNLSDIGTELPPSAIEQALLHPLAPMPSFKGLPRRELRSLAYFLSELRGGGG